MQNIDINLPVRIKDELFTQQPEGQPINIGDVVLDLKDGCFGVCDCLFNNGTHIAVMSYGCAEVGVPVTRVRKLIKKD